MKHTRAAVQTQNLANTTKHGAKISQASTEQVTSQDQVTSKSTRVPETDTEVDPVSPTPDNSFIPTINTTQDKQAHITFEPKGQNTIIYITESDSFPDGGESDWDIFQLLQKQVQGRQKKAEDVFQTYPSLGLTHKVTEREDVAMLIKRFECLDSGGVGSGGGIW